MDNNSSINNNNSNNREFFTINILQILKALWHKAWLIVLVGILAAAIGFSYSAFFITPTYSSSILLYVNNSDVSLGNMSFDLSASDINASRSLVDTYTVLLKNRTTLEKIISRTQVPYSYRTLNGMIVAEPANETEVMKITVTSTDPYEAAKIANGIAEVFPERVSEIIDGATMEVVDTAIPVLEKVAPSVTKYTALGLFIGVFAVCAYIAIESILDDTIHDEEFILQHFDCPILAKVPNLLDNGNKRYGYYYKYKTQSGSNSKKGE